jgi:tripartite-type tricarboxylate transporter receptor subunit TctC
MKQKPFMFMVVVFITLALIYPAVLPAAPYYEGKVITMTVGSGPGGGYDRMARIFAKHLPKYIPGKPTIIIENMEGATSIIAANYIYNIAKPDGLTIGIVNRGLPFAQLMKTEGVKFDLTKFAWIGSPSVESNVLTVRADTPYKSVEDLRNAKIPIKFGAGGVASSSTHFPLLLKAFAGIKNILMVQYRSSSEVALAIERKEVDGKATSFASFRTQIENGSYRPLIRGRVIEPGIEKLPVDEDLTNDPIGKKLMALRSGPDRIGRPVIAPPKTPDKYMNILRDAFTKACKDPEVAAMADKLEMRVEYVPPDECLKILKDIFSQPDNIVKEFSKYIKF